jgi:hypothetical protein
MVRISLFVCGAVLIAGALVAGLFLKIGATDAEYGNILRTGSPSRPAEFQWSEWRINDGSVTPFPGQASPTARLSQFRVGHAQGSLFDFTAYEGRSASDDSSPAIAALGPAWGVSYRGIWLVPISIGVVIILAGIFVRAHTRV